jgi:ribosomal protein S18 acetylase RimI-like enzyme
MCKFEYKIFEKEKAMEISETKGEITEESLTLAIEAIKLEFKDYSIVFELFTDNDPDAKIKKRVMSKTGFKLMMHRPVFQKMVEKQPENYRLTFKTLKDLKSEELFTQMYKEAIKDNTHLVSQFLDASSPEGTLEMNATVPEWNIMGFDGDKPVGFVCIGERNYLSKFGTILYIAILKEHRGKGYAKEFLRKIENEFYKAGILKWYESTDEGNKPMINGFLSYGFKQVRKMYGYIYRPEIAFKKFLHPPYQEKAD